MGGCGPATDARIESSMRPHCRYADTCRAKTPGKHCSPCTISALWKDPAFREKRRLAYKAALADPEFRAKHNAASAARLAAWRATPDAKPGADVRSRANLAIANRPENLERRNRAIRAQAYAGIPESRWGEVQALARRMPAAEAKRIILEDERAKARREITATAEAMRARQAREKAQAY
jgi:hypothetical protein